MFTGNDVGESLESLTSLHHLDLHYGLDRINDAWLVHLRCLTELRELDLRDTAVADEAIKVLVATRMERLNLQNTRVTSAALERLSSFPDLEELVLTYDQVDNVGLKCITPLS